MMNKITNIRVSGFTILETMITMVLSSLLMLIVLATLQYYMRLFSNVIKVEEKQTEICLFKKVITKDVNQASKVFFQDDLTCVNNNSTIEYSFAEDKIIRNNSSIVDTFFIKHAVTTVQTSPEQTGMVEKLVIECFNKDLILPVSLIKKYPLVNSIEKK